MHLNYLKKSLRTSTILTGSFVEATILGPQGIGSQADPAENNQIVLYVAFTLGSLTSAELKVEFSDDDTTYYQETVSSISGGTSTDSLLTHTYTASGNYRIPIPLVDRFIKVSVKGTGTTTDSLMALDIVLATRP